jgi:hypothetical protein
MATTTGTFNWYNKGKKHLCGSVNLESTPDFRVLLTSSSHTPSSTTHEFVSDITNELTTNGANRHAIASEVWTEPVAGTWMLDFDNPTWTASGGSIVARNWHMYEYNASDASAVLICWGLLDATAGGTDVTTTNTNVLTANINANGIFRVS